MAFDLSKVLAAAEEVVNQNQGGGSFSGPKLIYPGFGELSLRILFNPKSQSVLRLVARHKINNKNLICASTYNQDCPLCVGVETYKTRTGSDMWTMDAKRIGLVLAQYVGVSRDYDNGSYQLPEKGELVCAMLPWSAYKQMSECIQRAGERASELLTTNEGKIINLIKKKGSNIVEYSVEVDAFSRPFKSSNNQSEFEEFLMELPDLNDVYCPATMPDDLLQKLQSEADTLNGKVNQAVAQDAGVKPNANPGTSVPSPDPVQPSTPVNPDPAPSPESSTEDSYSCKGNFKSKDRKCLMCEIAVECAKLTKANAKG